IVRFGPPSLPSRFCFWELTSNFPVGHPSWDCSSANSLNFGVPSTPKLVSSQKVSTILSALGPPLCPHGFVSGSSRATSQWVTHPKIALASNSL
ncbi:unnamed protein product, partial [Prunus brigantina]